MKTVKVNEQQVSVHDRATLVDVVGKVLDRDLEPDGRPTDGGRLGVAVSIDGQVVPRTAWQERVVDDGTEIDLVTAVQGG
ncbi:sulfur carrier protein ThiS [Kocuria koreensis]|uniref:Sulfur carrier protein ThiS n=1 Tax=Rothia koreensis TaxID=592378 RepID=A0A7K1LH14_9MICC|nr:sulfur carrier protein ThiS [Rothia koreensis]MUN54476.1 sulfur carrier protein ThiS [Rothia koreensis]